ncbi:hypothetical protein GGS23DRAFT_614746 [Durotheca rogersii]|uniref:uncharacterized protein n=1 Tax=Durotheca rogersii TaxID=419775 RepID=UPI0022206E3E|nr:uncharacterized protein GGS23DRAFT_614746 [Durotheca rogersii]KAI5859724.1 hypothetical protein GGS23DRAFT_614746 [Durotheca rogersii]
MDDNGGGISSPVDTANLAAAWLSFAVTAAGLGGLISQASAINEKLDPFRATRTAEYLGIWFRRQAAFPWWRIAKPPPQGPVVAAGIAAGFCGVSRLHVTRIPLAPPGRAGWPTVLAMFNARPRSSSESDGSAGWPTVLAMFNARPRSSSSSSESDGSAGDDGAAAYADSWGHLERRPLKRYQAAACIVISRTTLITMLVATNGRAVFQYSDASGFRAGYASYCGQWYITWPIGQEAVVKFAAHESLGTAEQLPRSFMQRVDRCGQIAAGVILVPPSPAAADSDADERPFALAFPGRRPAGTYQLEHMARGFQGAHSGRHLYNMMGGRAHEVDFLAARPVPWDAVDVAQQVSAAGLVLRLPCRDRDRYGGKLDVPAGFPGGGAAWVVVPPAEEALLRRALDGLPWVALSWSAHRGLRDVLLAYGRPTMDAHRAQLAGLLRGAAARHAGALRARGWDAAFVRDAMAPMAAAAVLAGPGGNSGDAVRVVTDLAAVAVAAMPPASDAAPREWSLAQLDDVRFWRDRPLLRGTAFRAPRETPLDAAGVVALTKLFVLEWSQEFDYQLYHHLPISLYFA